MTYRNIRSACLVLVLLLASSGALAQAPITPVRYLDLPRYMGRWYVIAAIPADFGANAYNMVETYRRMADGGVCTSLWFHDGGFNGPIERAHHPARVIEGSGHAEWQVQVFWFIDAQYLVAWLKDDYSQVIVARDKRDYVWLMARTPRISKPDYQAMVARVKALGYDVSRLRKVPQKWPQAEQKAPPTFAEACD